jgi:hypothetical protein
MKRVKVSEATAARRRVYFDLRLASDGVSPALSEAGGQPQISVDGGAWTNTGIGTLTHTGNGRYYADLTTLAIGTVGQSIATRYKSANTLELPGDTMLVVNYDPYASPWELTPRTLTQAGAQVAAAVQGSDINVKRGDTVIIALTDLGSFASSSEYWFTIKKNLSDADSLALVQVSGTGGLVCLNGAAPASSGDGTFVVNDTDTGDVTITLKPPATALLQADRQASYDIQLRRTDGTITTLTEGKVNLVSDVTRTISSNPI